MNTVRIPCIHLGDEINGQTRERLGLTHLKVWRECEKGHGPQCSCNRSCGPTCADYSPNAEESDVVALRYEQNANYPSVGISIGSYGMPGLIELQAKVIRANCGNIPVIVSDDQTDEAGETGPAKKSRLIDVCEKYGLIFRDAAANRVGHAGGDLGAFWHGLNYAAEHGIEYWLKLSQRFVIDRPLFAQKCAAMMNARDSHTMSQTHKNRGKFFFAMRTEFVMMEVRRWNRPELIDSLRPRPIGRAAEDVVHGCVKRLGGAIIACPLFTPERSKPHKDLLWYEADGPAGYDLMAAKYGVELGDGFHATYSIHSPNFKWG